MRFAPRMKSATPSKALDLRDDAGERVIAPRRAPSRAPISESALRREVNADLARPAQHHQSRRRGSTSTDAPAVRAFDPQLRLSRPQLAHDRRKPPDRDVAREIERGAGRSSSRGWRATRSRSSRDLIVDAEALKLQVLRQGRSSRASRQRAGRVRRRGRARLRQDQDRSAVGR